MLLLWALGCVETQVNAIEYSDTWVQGERDRGVDVLWVRDDSATMTEEQDLLLAAAAAFTDGLAAAPVDFRLALVSTDVDTTPAGTLAGPVITADDEDLAAAFAALVATTADGSRDERGIESAIAGSDPDTNPDFARADADLEVIVFSDEDDHGDDELDEVVAALTAPREGEVRVSALVGDAPEGCASLVAAADPGLRYLALQDATDGLRGSICSPDYDALLRRVGLHALGMTDRFFLNQFPDTSSLEVWVDDTWVLADDDTGWTYEIGDNSLRFASDAVPPPGATVYASYKPFVGYRLDEAPAE